MDNIEYFTLTYEEFVNKLENNEITDIDFNNNKIQKYYIYYNIIKDNKIDNASLQKKFHELTKINLSISKFKISRIWNKICNEYKHLSLEEILIKIESLNVDVERFTYDIKYQYKEKNKEVERKQRIYIIGQKKIWNY